MLPVMHCILPLLYWYYMAHFLLSILLVRTGHLGLIEQQSYFAVLITSKLFVNESNTYIFWLTQPLKVFEYERSIFHIK